jgi:hypothetical protein
MDYRLRATVARGSTGALGLFPLRRFRARWRRGAATAGRRWHAEAMSPRAETLLTDQAIQHFGRKHFECRLSPARLGQYLPNIRYRLDSQCSSYRPRIQCRLDTWSEQQHHKPAFYFSERRPRKRDASPDPVQVPSSSFDWRRGPF